MGFIDKLKKNLTGLTVPQEYCCLELENLVNPFTVSLTLRKQHFRIDVSSDHLFLGYRPLVIGLQFDAESQEYLLVEGENEVCLNFTVSRFEGNTTWQGFSSDKKAVARLMLRVAGKKTVDNRVILFYTGSLGVHSFLSPFHQWVNRQKQNWQRKPESNVGLPGNLWDQVRIAYSIPRIISVISISDGQLLNMFPTDLHGAAGEVLYVSSLRLGGRANTQVESYKKLVISDVECTSYRYIYGLGKNHMSDLKSQNDFITNDNRSEFFDFPLPAAVTQYRELKQTDSLDIGIHRIHIYQVVNRKTVHHDRPTLAHIHQYYAQWRIDQGQQTALFFR